jgi:uncharacterized protein GlcG (DUF336 family)
MALTFTFVADGGIGVTNGVSGDDFPGSATVSNTRAALDISGGSPGNSTTITVTGSPSSIVWKIDGAIVSAFAGASSKTFTAVYVKTANTQLTVGTHTITITATFDGVQKSKTVALTVTE